MLNRDEMKAYALKICVPLMERNIQRSLAGRHAYKPDQVGYVPADLENFCRPFWGIAPILAEGENIILQVQGKEISVFEYVRDFLKEGLSHGTEKSWDKYREHFGAYKFENQNVTELAGLAIGIFFARKQLWEPLSDEDKKFIADELYYMSEIALDHSWANNHYWFPLFVITVLKRLGFVYDRTNELLENGLDFLDTLYVGDGWYQDGGFGRFDYYEAWSLHLYPLLWTLIADESFEKYVERKKAYIERTNQFLEFYTHWFGADGANVPFGRSMSYRFAACSLFPAAVLAGCEIDPALAGRITAANIGFFSDHVYTEDSDILPEGYLYRTTNVIEGYTSDAGAYWSCKAFLALLIEKDHPFWNVEAARMPAEKGDFLVEPKHKDIHMLYEGHEGMVTLYNNTAQYYRNNKFVHPFGDVKSWYSKFVYNSACGFGCAAPDRVSIDNMISLTTPDFAMTSHRLGFTDLGYENGVLHSIHTPFSNDPDSTIETYVIPMGGMHVRIHKVVLSRPYYVKEGGYAVGRWDDYCLKEGSKDSFCVSNHDYISSIKAVSSENAKIKCLSAEVQAFCHMYAPLAEYPMYETEVPLETGEYIFAAAVSLDRVLGKKAELPEITIENGKVIVTLDKELVFEKEF